MVLSVRILDFTDARFCSLCDLVVLRFRSAALHSALVAAPLPTLFPLRCGPFELRSRSRSVLFFLRLICWAGANFPAPPPLRLRLHGPGSMGLLGII